MRKEVLPVRKEVLPGRKEVLPVRDEVLPMRKEVLPVRNEVPPVRNEVLPVHNEVLPQGGGCLLVSGTPPAPALLAHLVTKGQWLRAIHRVVPKAPENFVPFAGDPRECRG